MTSELEPKVFLVALRINSHVPINYVDEESLGALHDRESESGLNESSDRFSSTMLGKDDELRYLGVARQQGFGKRWIKMLEGKCWDLSDGGDPNHSLIDVVECRYTVQAAVIELIS
jgi:hypothetical protein